MLNINFITVKFASDWYDDVSVLWVKH